MSDILSIARRLAEYAKRRGPRQPVTAQEREDLLTAADGLRHLNALLNAVEQKKPDG